MDITRKIQTASHLRVGVPVMVMMTVAVAVVAVVWVVWAQHDDGCTSAATPT